MIMPRNSHVAVNRSATVVVRRSSNAVVAAPLSPASRQLMQRLRQRQAWRSAMLILGLLACVLLTILSLTVRNNSSATPKLLLTPLRRSLGKEHVVADRRNHNALRLGGGKTEKEMSNAVKGGALLEETSSPLAAGTAATTTSSSSGSSSQGSSSQGHNQRFNTTRTTSMSTSTTTANTTTIIATTAKAMAPI